MAGTSLGDVIDRARRQSFVGRRSELRTFDDARAGQLAYLHRHSPLTAAYYALRA